jgi:zinc transport system substrate-binding protein
MKKVRQTIVLMLAALLVTVLSSCGTRDRDHEDGRKKITVVTTLFPLYDFTRVIARDRADVTLLLPPGVEAHAFEPKPADMVRISSAGLFVYTGKYMEPWAEEILKGTSNKTLIVRDASQGIKLMHTTENDHDEADDGHGHHDHGTYDPHIWLDFENAMKMVDTITDGLSAADPANSAFYKQNAARYKEELLALDARFRETLRTCRKKVLVHGGHFAFGYLARRYGLEYVSAYQGSPNAEPTARKIIALEKIIKEKGVRYVYFEELINPKVSELLSRETGATLLSLHGAHNVTKDELAKGSTFISLMDANLANLKIGLECR